MVRRAFSAAVLVWLAAAGVATATLLAASRSGAATSPAAPGCTGATATTAPPPTTAPETAAGIRATAAGATTVASTTSPGVGTGTTTVVVTTTPGARTTGAVTTAPSVPPTTARLPATTEATTTSPSTTPGTTSVEAGSCETTTAATGTTSTAPGQSPSAGSAGVLVLTGHGYGHGMGMGQWGAYGYALHGWTAPQILAHYYSGTMLGQDPAPNVRVLLASGRPQVTLESTSRWRVVDARGKKLRLLPGQLVVPTTLRVRKHTLVSPLTFVAGATPLEVNGHPYHGKIVVVSNGRSLQVVNTVAMTDYLDGVVGSEMPSTWPAAALEAQAIAARSYALAAIDDDVTASPFDLYGDTRSQVYGGIDAESPPVLEAVAATAGKVVLYDGQVATTYYSASTGGQTVSAQEVTGTAVPYLVSVPDPYDTYSPYHDWGPIVLSAAEAGKRLGLPGPLVDLETVPGPSHHVLTATAVGTTSQLSLSGPQVEADLGLRSTWFDAGWLSLNPPSAAVVSGSELALTGIARGLTGVTLEAQSAGGSWQRVGDVVPAADGSFSATVSPQTTTSYRLALGSFDTGPVTVEVVAAVTATPVADGVYGTVTPPAAGDSVSLQHENDGVWTTVAHAQTMADGHFVVHARLQGGGIYRAACAPGNGLLAGTSSLLTVAAASTPSRGRAP